MKDHYQEPHISFIQFPLIEDLVKESVFTFFFLFFL